MAIGDTAITFVGNLVADPELRFTNNGAAVCNVRVASTPRSYNKDTNQWEDGESTFLSGSVWREQAENVANSLAKGQRVIVNGFLKQRNYETPEGEKRSVYEIEIEDIGPSLKYATAQPIKTGGNGGSNFNQQQQGGFAQQQQGGFAQPQQGGFAQQQPQGQQVQQGQQQDVWNSAPQQQGGFPAEPNF